MTHRSRSTQALAALATILVAVTAAGAQQTSTSVPNARATTVSVVGGVSQFDLSGTGTAAVFGVRLDRELNSVFLGEAALTAMRPAEQFGARSTYLFPELLLQAQIPFAVVRPYVGIGGGFAAASAPDRPSETTGTMAGAGGIRVLIPNTSTTIRAELRVRGIGSGFTGAVAEWTLGVGRRF